MVDYYRVIKVANVMISSIVTSCYWDIRILIYEISDYQLSRLHAIERSGNQTIRYWAIIS